MAKLENSQDKQRLKVVSEELDRFKKLIAGHEKILIAIGNL
ncbi:MAG: hypothetical protein V2A62_04625 [Candidatus Woesearchaeota archaeon]